MGFIPHFNAMSHFTASISYWEHEACLSSLLPAALGLVEKTKTNKPD